MSKLLLEVTEKQADFLLELISEKALLSKKASEHAQMNRICYVIYQAKRKAKVL